MDKSSTSNLKRKPSIKKLPVIKQTKTSMIRMVNANPLLLSNDPQQKKYKNDLVNIEIPKSFSFQNAKEFKCSNSISIASTNTSKSTNRTNNVKKYINANKDITVKKTSQTLTENGKNNNTEPYNFIKPSLKRTQSLRTSRPTTITTKACNPPKTKVINEEKKPPKRRSLSAEHYDRQNKKLNILQKAQRGREITKGSTNRSNQMKRRSLSAENFDPKFMESTPKGESFRGKSSYVSPIVEENSQHHTSGSLKTPKNNHRVFFSTPMTSMRKSYIFKNDICSRLNEWLKKRGQLASTYSHLKCFGIRPTELETIDDENKENIEKVVTKSESYEDLKIPESLNQNTDDYKVVAEGAVNDLFNLINDGYNEQQCLIWLNLIHEKYPDIEHHPKFWECRAALEQCRGKLTDAIECYKRALVKGANVEEVDDALENLLTKFSVLNISNSCKEPETNDKLKREKVFVLQQARNAFKSSVIQFAIKEKKQHERAERECMKKVMVTPVRRSVRISGSCTTTPGIRICPNLCQFEPDDVLFQNNPALSVRYN